MRINIKAILFSLFVLLFCTVGTYAQSNFVYVLNPSTITGFAVNNDGQLAQIQGSPFPRGGISSGYLAAPPEMVVSPVADFLYVANMGSHSISAFSINPVTGYLTPVAGSPFYIPMHPGDPYPWAFAYPGSLAMPRDGKFLFVAAERGRIVSFRVNAGGSLTFIQSPVPFYGNKEGRLKVSADGKYLYAVENLYQAVSVFNITAEGQVLPERKSSFTLTEDGQARFLESNCDGTLLFVPSFGLRVFSVSPSGILTNIPGSPFPVVQDQYMPVVLSPDEKFIFLGDHERAKLAVGSVAPGGSVSQVANSTISIGDPNNEDRRPIDIDIQKDGKFIYVLSADSTMLVYTTSPEGLLSPVSGSPFLNPGGSGYGADLLAYPGKRCPAVQVFDLCIQDESNGNRLQINTMFGDYQMTNCSGFTLGGKGTLTRRGSTITLQHNSSDRRVVATIDTGTNRATASLQMLSQGRMFSISDRNILNNTCACR